MGFKIISDSSSDILEMSGVSYASVPLKILTDEKEYVDDISLNVDDMISDLQKYNGTSRSSCPNVADWKESFENYDNIFCITITSALSGSYNSANLAVKEYLAEFPEKKATVLDSLSTGPENALIIEKLQELISQNLPFDVIEEKIREYMKKIHLFFSLESMKNLANNGRVSKTVAIIAGIIGIRIIGKASDEGTLEVIGKTRGAQKALNEIYDNMTKSGYKGGKVRIHHCQNENAAHTIEQKIKAKFPNAVIKINKTRALCSFYAESGGLLLAFEETP